MLWLCLLFPSLPLDVFARAQTPDETARPLAVTTGGHYPRVVASNAAASHAGVHEGQLISASLAFEPDLVMRERDAQAESAALAAVASWTTQFTPAVSLAPPNAILAEIGGCLRLFGGLRSLARDLMRGANDLGYRVRLAVAPTPTAALLFARTGKSGACDAAVLEQALAALPLAKLDVATEAVALLAAAGITTIGQACALPRDALARRVGQAFVATLDRARGSIADPRPPFISPPRYEGKLELPAAIEDVEALAFALNRLVHELAGWLLGRGLGVTSLSLSLLHERYATERCGIPATTVRFGLAAPARDAAHLLAVLRERLARVTLPAPMIALLLASVATAPLAGRNLGLLPGDEAAAAVPLLDRLRARLGEESVLRVMPHAEHRPERSWRIQPPSSLRSPPSEGDARTEPMAADPRPIWLLVQPEPIGYAFESHPWVLRDGPERIESGWWDGEDVRRDYFVAENPRGEMAWIYRDHRYGIDDGEWFMHGLFS